MKQVQGEMKKQIEENEFGEGKKMKIIRERRAGTQRKSAAEVFGLRLSLMVFLWLSPLNPPPAHQPLHRHLKEPASHQEESILGRIHATRTHDLREKPQETSAT